MSSSILPDLDSSLMVQGPLAPGELPPFTATTDPAATLAPSADFPVVTGYTTYLAPPISRWGAEGFSSCLISPGHRAVALTPPEWAIVSVSLRLTMLPSSYGSGLDLRNSRPHEAIFACTFVTAR